MAEAPRHPVSPLRAGLLCRCPNCGQGRLYSGYLKIVEACATCGLALRKHDAGDGPAVFVVLVVGGIIVGLAMWVELSYQPPYWVHGVIWLPAILGGCLGALRPAKALMIALQFKLKVLDFDEDN
jgi:uncharacterized protein (DUF983 family)